MKTLSENDISIACKLVENGDISLAWDKFREICTYDLKNKEIRFGIWCCSFWATRVESSEKVADAFDRAETLISDWKEFLQSMVRECGDDVFDREVSSFKIGIFTVALKCYEGLNVDGEENSLRTPQILRKIALCYKKLGDYEKAFDFLSKANIQKPNDPAIIAELGDSYALIADERTARILLKEAFFIDASKIDLDFLDSDLICSLVRSVGEKGYSGSVLNEWIPVYGVLYGVFNIKRALRSQEVGRLRQDIYSLENDLKDPSNPSDLLKPRLINLYFWLIDYYVLENDASGKINDVLVKIRLQDENIYKQYIK